MFGLIVESYNSIWVIGMMLWVHCWTALDRVCSCSVRCAGMSIGLCELRSVLPYEVAPTVTSTHTIDRPHAPREDAVTRWLQKWNVNKELQ